MFLFLQVYLTIFNKGFSFVNNIYDEVRDLASERGLLGYLLWSITQEMSWNIFSNISILILTMRSGGICNGKYAPRWLILSVLWIYDQCQTQLQNLAKWNMKMYLCEIWKPICIKYYGEYMSLSSKTRQFCIILMNMTIRQK